MIVFTLLLLFINRVYTTGGSCTPKMHTPIYQQLKDDLLCTYDRSVRPVMDINNQTKVNIGLYPTFIEMDEHNNAITWHSWIQLSWKDEFLQWKPEDYGNIKYIYVTGEDIWMPDVFDFNRRSSSPELNIGAHSAAVNNLGRVFVLALLELKAHCKMDVRKWPYDRHSCGSLIGSKTYLGTHLDLILNNSSLNLAHYTGSRSWKLEEAKLIRKVNVLKSNSSTVYYVTVQCKFTVSRQASIYTATVVLPFVGMIIMNLIHYWQNPLELIRFILIIFSLSGHYLTLQYISWLVPANADTPVVILYLMENSLAIAALGLLVLIVNRNIISERPIPIWLNNIRFKICRSQASWILFLSEGKPNEGTDEEAVLNSSHKFRNEWMIITSAIDRIMFYVSLLIYIVMILVFLML